MIGERMLRNVIRSTLREARGDVDLHGLVIHLSKLIGRWREEGNEDAAAELESVLTSHVGALRWYR